MKPEVIRELEIHIKSQIFDVAFNGKLALTARDEITQYWRRLELRHQNEDFDGRYYFQPGNIQIV